MASVRILHASDLHIAHTPNLVAVNDRLSAGISLKKIARKLVSPAAWKALVQATVVSSYDPTLLLALAEFIVEDYDRNHIPAGQGDPDAKPPLDALLFTGDIATTGLDIDLLRARRFLADTYHRLIPAKSNVPRGGATIRRVLDHDDCSCARPVRLCLMPGNHDRLQPAFITSYSPGGKRFDQLLSPFWYLAAYLQHYGKYVRELRVVKDSLRVSVFAADFNLRHRKHCEGKWWNKYAQGRVYRQASNSANGIRDPKGELDILERLVAATESATRDDPRTVVLWATHFPPRYPYIRESMKLIDDEHLVREANRLGVAAVLGGHTHEPASYSTPGMTFDVLCAGTATQHHSGHGHFFHVVEIDDDDGPPALTVKHFQFASTKFVPV